MIDRKNLFICLILFSLAFVVYYFSSGGNTSYDYFTRLAASFLEGKLYLTDNPPWLNELIPVYGVYFVVYPPMPAVLAVPFVFIFGHNFSQTIFSILVGSVNVVLVYLLGLRLKFGHKTAILVSLFFGFGTNHWYLASVGSAWYIAHVVAIFFLLLALIEAFGKERLLLIGLLFGASFWARTPIIFTVGFFVFFFRKQFWPLNAKNILNVLKFGGGIGAFVAFDAWYNFIRFSSWNVLAPYEMIPGVKDDPIFEKGFMSISYIPRHLKAMFLDLPTLRGTWPYIIPSLYSLAIWVTSPWVLLLFLTVRKAKRNWIVLCALAAIIPTLFVIMLWGGVGFTQFGYRFAQDFMPFLLIILFCAIGKKPAWYVYLLLIISILINLWGVVLINKFNIWSL
jgi:hypothetical protein